VEPGSGTGSGNRLTSTVPVVPVVPVKIEYVATRAHTPARTLALLASYGIYRNYRNRTQNLSEIGPKKHHAVPVPEPGHLHGTEDDQS